MTSEEMELPFREEVALLGHFAIAAHKRGLGKIVRIKEALIELEYFESINSTARVSVDPEHVQPVRLFPQTRCYVKCEDHWKIGRVLKTVDDLVEISFPDKRTEYIDIKDVYVRCSLPINNPTEVLSYWGQETAYFYERRQRFLKGLLEQRAVSEGMNGLLSSSIELLSHQVLVAKKVLDDPIPRYLLADEVGLGKTIEAGIVLRQALLDDDQIRALVIAPPAILGQWQRELCTKFHTSQWPNRIQFCAYEEIGSIDTRITYDFLIIDEAHHVAQWYCSEDGENLQRYSLCQRLSHEAKGVLLLSATPGLDNEKAFLSLLNLLDPLHFKLEKIEDFKLLMGKREEISKVLFGMTESSPNAIVQSSILQLKKLFGEDTYFLALLTQLEAFLASGIEDEKQRGALIRQLRTTIIEAYRVSRRILRTKRSDVWKIQRLKPVCEFGESEYEEQIIAKLHDWRLDALEQCQFYPERQNIYQNLYFLFHAALNCSYKFFREIISIRLIGQDVSGIIEELHEEELIALEAPSFDAEQSTLESIIEVLDFAVAEEGAKDEMLKGRLDLIHKKDNTSKVTIFVSFTPVAKDLYDHLSSLYGPESVSFINQYMDEETIQEEVADFRNEESRWILISDRIGEEGLNLQFADRLIHYDLPWSPNRIEQRIGRLDRIGQHRPIKSYIFLGSVEEETIAPFLPYYQFLEIGLCIFDKSINSLQFLMGALLPQFLRFLFEEGGNLTTDVIWTKLEEVKAEVKKEEKRVHQQHMVDLFIDNVAVNAQFFSRLEKFEKDYQTISLQFEPWLKEAMKFVAQHGKQKTTYIWTPNTLLPVNLLLNDVEVVTKFKGTYDRVMAAASDLPLFRLGNPFIDMISDHFQWDDRGKTYALWRKVPGISQEWMGFKFDLLLQANQDAFHACSNHIQKTMMRKADALFSPIMTSIFITLEGRIERDEAILSHLKQSFSKYDRFNNPHGSDYNLTKDKLAILQNEFTDKQWQAYCSKAYKCASTAFLESEEVTGHIQAALGNLNGFLLRKKDQLSVYRVGEFEDSNRHHTEEEELDGGLKEAIEHPSLKVDSVGFFWLSPIIPQV